jgi:hypothetical protein
VRARCRVNGDFAGNSRTFGDSSPASLFADVRQFLEHSLWATLRTMEERTLLLQHLGRHPRDHQDSQVAEVAKWKARGAEQPTIPRPQVHIETSRSARGSN